MTQEQKSIDLSVISFDQGGFDISRASILLDDRKEEQTSGLKKEGSS